MYGRQSRRNKWPEDNESMRDSLRHSYRERPQQGNGERVLGRRQHDYQPTDQHQHQPSAQYLGLDEAGHPPPGALNVVSYEVPNSREQQPVWVVPPKKEPRYVTVEVKEPDPEPILVMPPPLPKQRIIEYQVAIKQKDPEPILVPVMPPPPEPEYVTVRQLVEEPPPHDKWTVPLAQPEYGSVGREPDMDYNTWARYQGRQNLPRVRTSNSEHQKRHRRK